MSSRTAVLLLSWLLLAPASHAQDELEWPPGSSRAGPLSPLELVSLLVHAAEDKEHIRSVEARQVLAELGRLNGAGEVLLARAYMSADTQDCGRAQAALDRATEKGDRSVTARQIEGMIAYSVGEHERAYELLIDALEGGERNCQALASLINVALELGRAGEACDLSLRGARENLLFAEPQYQVVQACLAADREEPALAALDRALAIDAAHRGSRLARGRRLVRSPDSARAAQGRIDLKVHALLNQDWDLSIRSPDDLDSIAERRRIDAQLIELEPEEVQWRLRQAETLSQGNQQDIERAHEVVLAARKHLEDRSSMALACGIAYRTGDLRLAAELAKAALSDTRDSLPAPPARESKAATILANLLMRQGRFEEARPWLEHGTSLHAYRSDLRALMGALYAGMNESALAEREFGIALQLGSKDPHVRKRLGVLLAGSGQLESARAHLEAAQRAMPDDPEIPALLRQIRSGR